MRLKPAHVGLEPIDLEARLLERERHQVLGRALIAGHRGNPHKVLRQPDAGVGVERLERPGFRPLSRQRTQGRNWCCPR